MAVECLAHLHPIHLSEFKILLGADTRGKATKAHAMISLRSFLQWGSALHGHDLRMESVKYILEVPKTTVVTPHETLNPKEIDAFLHAAHAMGPRAYALAMVALGSGVRVAELVALDIKDVRFDAGGGTVIHVRQGKGNKDRMIPVRKEVRQAVELYLKASGRTARDLGPLFTAEDRAINSRDVWRITTKSAGRLVREMAERADIKKRISPHALRHTFAYTSYMHRRNPMAIQKLLGHSSLNTTMRYLAHLDDLDLRDTISPALSGSRALRKAA